MILDKKEMKRYKWVSHFEAERESLFVLSLESDARETETHVTSAETGKDSVVTVTY